MKKKRTKIPFSNELKEFFNTLFPYNQKYHGNIIFKSKEINYRGFPYMKNISFIDINDKAYFDQMYFFQDKEYFFSPQTHITDRAVSDNVFSYNCIAIDLDMHDYCYEYIDGSCEDFFYRFWGYCREHEEIPKPAYIVKSGRGMHLYYPIVSLSYKLKSVFEEARNIIIESLSDFLQPKNEEDQRSQIDRSYSMYKLKVDTVASKKEAALFRVPTTTNKKLGINTKLIRFPDWKEENRINAIYFVNSHNKKNKKNKKRNFTNKKWNTEKNEDQSYINIDYNPNSALKMIYEIFDERGHVAGDESRDLYLYCVYNCLVESIGHEAALKEVHKFNEKFIEPLSDKEIMSYLSSSFRKHYYCGPEEIKNKLYLSNQEIKENKYLFKSTNDKKKNESHRQYKKITEDEEKKIVALCKKGLNKSQIAKETGKSNTVISYVLRSHKLKTKKEKNKEKVIKLFKKESYSTKEIAELTEMSVRNVQLIIKKYKENEINKEAEVTEEEIIMEQHANTINDCVDMILEGYPKYALLKHGFTHDDIKEAKNEIRKCKIDLIVDYIRKGLSENEIKEKLMITFKEYIDGYNAWRKRQRNNSHRKSKLLRMELKLGQPNIPRPVPVSG